MRTTHHIPANTRWRRSSYSNAAGGDCVEVADGVPSVIPVHDSKRRTGPALLIDGMAWTAAFIAEIKRDRLERHRA